MKPELSRSKSRDTDDVFGAETNGCHSRCISELVRVNLWASSPDSSHRKALNFSGDESRVMAEEEDGGSADSPEELNRAARSMVVIRKKSELSVFPPINHENLQTPPRLLKEEEEEEEEGQNSPSSFSSDLLSSSITSSSSTSSFPPSEDGDEVGIEERGPPRSEVQVDLGGWWRIGFGILRSKAWGVVGWPFGCRNAAGARSLWPFVPAAAAVMWLFLWRLRLWRWWSRRGSVDPRLARLVKEKDQKIAQLLNQIAQMNGLLISRQTA